MNAIQVRMKWKQADKLANKYREEYGPRHPITQEAVANAAIWKKQYKEHVKRVRVVA